MTVFVALKGAYSASNASGSWFLAPLFSVNLTQRITVIFIQLRKKADFAEAHCDVLCCVLPRQRGLLVKLHIRFIEWIFNNQLRQCDDLSMRVNRINS